jgi:hypothetical protein
MTTLDDCRRHGRFARGITDTNFMPALRALAGNPGWWREVLDDPGLIIAIRENYLNVYWQGQSLFKIEHLGDRSIRAKTHPKYLLDPTLEKLVAFNGRDWTLPSYESMLTHRFVPGETLSKLKKAAKAHSDREKEGVHQIACRNSSVLDVEIAIPGMAAMPGELGSPRLDIAALEQDGDCVRLVFWEAKLFENEGLRAMNDRTPAVLGQIDRYKRGLDSYRDCVLASYRQVARNLVEIAEMSAGSRKVDPLVLAVATRPDSLTMAQASEVGLLVYRYDADQDVGRAWAPHKQRLIAALPGRFLARGNAKDIRLAGNKIPVQPGTVCQ